MAEQFWSEILSFADCCKSLLVGTAHTSTSYQNTVYNAARAPQTISEPAKNPFVTLNMEASTANDVPEELWPPGGAGLWPSRLMITIPITQKIKTISIRSKKGIS